MEFLTNTNVDFLSKRRTGFLVSAVLILIGFVSLGIHRGPHFGIDFRGGVEIYAEFDRAVTESDLKPMLTKLGYDRAKFGPIWPKRRLQSHSATAQNLGAKR